MANETQSLIDGLGALMAKLWPGVLGSIVALRGMPADSTWGSRALSFFGGMGTSVVVTPGLCEWLGVSSQSIFALLSFLVGAFSMVVIGELTATVREVGLPAIVRDWIRKFLRLDRG